MTNDLSPLNQVQRTGDLTDFGWLTSMGPAGLTVFFVALIAYFCIRLAFVNTKVMWVFAIVGSVIYSIIGPLPHEAFLSGWFAEWTMKVVIAIALGIIGVFVAMILHDKGFRYLARFWPPLAVLSADTDSNGSQPKTNNP
jgi:hypothetical protein